MICENWGILGNINWQCGAKECSEMVMEYLTIGKSLLRSNGEFPVDKLGLRSIFFYDAVIRCCIAFKSRINSLVLQIILSVALPPIPSQSVYYYMYNLDTHSLFSTCTLPLSSPHITSMR